MWKIFSWKMWKYIEVGEKISNSKVAVENSTRRRVEKNWNNLWKNFKSKNWKLIRTIMKKKDIFGYQVADNK